ncbi:MAG TPA: tetratricopeptide repeat protein [Xanthobacteraceae bacterium]|nr:tetratricopeptide repeat protein [Xanthobacteraceae bacterium]
MLHDLGLARLRAGKLREALALLRAAVRLGPAVAEAHNNLGNALALSHHFDAALLSYRSAIALRADFAEAHNNLANVLMAKGRKDEAIAHYGTAVTLKPGYAEAALNLENARRATAPALRVQASRMSPATGLQRGYEYARQGKLAQAMDEYQRALALAPGLTAARLALADALFQVGRHSEALAAYETVDDSAEAWLGRARIFKLQQRPQDAVRAYREALARGADSDAIHYFLAAFGDEPPPTMAPKGLIRAAYDQHAAQYEQHMLGDLKYRIPDLLYEATSRFLPAQSVALLDLGCGTGLVGTRFKAKAHAMTGVDLSPNMLQLARQRQIYDRLACAELQEFLRATQDTFDLVTAADVLVYFGDLSGLFAEVWRVLATGGLFAFSVEAGLDRDFDLKSTLRFTHSREYLAKVAQTHGFAVEAAEQQVLRQEEKNDVVGYVAVLRKA